MPTYIDSDKFEILLKQLTDFDPEAFSVSASYDKDLAEPITYQIDHIFNECYKLDTNSTPFKYRLLPISKVLPDYNSSQLNRQDFSRNFWDKISQKLSSLLRQAANRAHLNGFIDEKERKRYFISSNFFSWYFCLNNTELKGLCQITMLNWYGSKNNCIYSQNIFHHNFVKLR